MADKLLIFRPAGIGFMRPETCEYLCRLCMKLARSGRFEDIGFCDWKDYRSMMGRNGAIKTAIQANCQYLLSIDPDMVPDMYVGRNGKAKEFFASSLDWLEKYPGGVVGAPAVLARPKRKSNVFRKNKEGELKDLTHEQCRESLERPRMERVDSIGSGLLLIDVSVCKKIKPPWFLDIYWDDTHSKLRAGQDVYFSHKVIEAGGKMWCNWYSWAGHIKSEVLGCPGL